MNNLRKIFCLLLFCVCIGCASQQKITVSEKVSEDTKNIKYPKKRMSESEYQKRYCEFLNGKTEHRLSDQRRVDCLTKNMAIEFDFASKVYECVGQALYYGAETNKKPCCVLILEDSKDYKYLKIIEAIRNKYKIINYDIIDNVQIQQKFKNKTSNSK